MPACRCRLRSCRGAHRRRHWSARWSSVVVIRHLYDRPLDTIVATWGLSLIATQGTLIMVGSTMAGVGTPFGSFTVGDYSYSIYRLVLFASALGVLAGLYMLFNWTRFGVLARATIQVPHMAAALGVDTKPDLQPHLCLRRRRSPALPAACTPRP